MEFSEGKHLKQWAREAVSFSPCLADHDNDDVVKMLLRKFLYRNNLKHKKMLKLGNMQILQVQVQVQVQVYFHHKKQQKTYIKYKTKDGGDAT